MTQTKWILTAEEKQKYIDALTPELSTLRAKAGISQGELCEMLGLSRQTISAIECGRKQMTWTTYLSLILFFDCNMATRDLLRHLPAYPEGMFLRINDGRPLDGGLLEQTGGELRDILKELDDQALHALKTMILVEYARCKKIPGDVVIKAFDGINLIEDKADISTELALKNIRGKRK